MCELKRLKIQLMCTKVVMGFFPPLSLPAPEKFCFIYRFHFRLQAKLQIIKETFTGITEHGLGSHVPSAENISANQYIQ